jgi:hypothetical protein
VVALWNMRKVMVAFRRIQRRKTGDEGLTATFKEE